MTDTDSLKLPLKPHSSHQLKCSLKLNLKCSSLIFQLACTVCRKKITSKKHPKLLQGQWISVRKGEILNSLWGRVLVTQIVLWLCWPYACLPGKWGGDYKDWLKAERALSLESLKDFGSPRQWYFKTSVLVGSKGVRVNRRVWGTFPIQGFYWAWKCQCLSSRSADNWNAEFRDGILLWWVLEILLQHWWSGIKSRT